MDKLLKKLLGAFGVSGREEEVRKCITSELQNLKYDLKEDKMGNLIVKAGSGKEKIMVCAHMDSVGFMVTYIEDNGTVKIGQVGDYKLCGLKGNKVKFENGTVGRLDYTGENPCINSMFVDIGAKGRKEAEKMVNVSQTAALAEDAYELNKNIAGANLDSRIGCYILLKVIKEIKNADKEIYFVFTSQKQLDGRGARAAAFEIKPDKCIVIDTIESKDMPEGSGSIRVGEGPVIVAMDRSLIANYKVKEQLEKAAEDAKIKVQYGVSAETSEGGLIHKEAGGIMTSVLAVPCRYKCSPNEALCMNDAEAAADLIVKFLS